MSHPKINRHITCLGCCYGKNDKKSHMGPGGCCEQQLWSSSTASSKKSPLNLDKSDNSINNNGDGASFFA